MLLQAGATGDQACCTPSSLTAAVQETRVHAPGQEDPLEEGMATHTSTLAWRIPMDRGAWRATYSPWGHKELRLTLSLSLLFILKKLISF